MEVEGGEGNDAIVLELAFGSARVGIRRCRVVWEVRARNLRLADSRFAIARALHAGSSLVLECLHR